MTKKAHSNKPKRVASAYIRFTSEERKKEEERGVGKKSVAEWATEYSKKWASLSPEEKKKYIDEYQRDMVEYKKAMDEYKNTDEYKEMRLKKSSEKRVAESKEKRPKKARNVSPYNIFVSEMYKKKKSEGEFDFKEVASLASEQWKSMSEQSKEEYQRKADEKNRSRRENENVVA